MFGTSNDTTLRPDRIPPKFCFTSGNCQSCNTSATKFAEEISTKTALKITYVNESWKIITLHRIEPYFLRFLYYYFSCSKYVFSFAKSHQTFSRTTATLYLKISSSSSSSFFLLAAMLITSASFCSSSSGLSLRTTIPRSWASRPAKRKQTKQSFIEKKKNCAQRKIRCIEEFPQKTCKLVTERAI